MGLNDKEANQYGKTRVQLLGTLILNEHLEQEPKGQTSKKNIMEPSQQHWKQKFFQNKMIFFFLS